MVSSVVVVDAADHERIVTRIWRPRSNPRAVVQIAHGMAEHSARYDDCAASLTRAGYVVYANDHRGHGRTVDASGCLGHFADRQGWRLAVSDLVRVTDTINEDYPGLPVVLFGHSMGSTLARDYASRFGERLAGLVLMGVQGAQGWKGRAGLALATVRRRALGARRPDRLMTRLSLGAYNAQFAPNRTTADWLSRDQDEVDAYLDDPRCGFTCTTTFFRDLLRAISRVNESATAITTPDDLPVLVLSGANDPVAGNTTAIYQVTRLLARGGVRDVTGRVYQGARHELLHELNRQQVIGDIIDWLDARLLSAGE